MCRLIPEVQNGEPPFPDLSISIAGGIQGSSASPPRQNAIRSACGTLETQLPRACGSTASHASSGITLLSSHSPVSTISPVLMSRMYNTVDTATTLWSPGNTSLPPSVDTISGLSEVHSLRATGLYLMSCTLPVLQSKLFSRSSLSAFLTLAQASYAENARPFIASVVLSVSNTIQNPRSSRDVSILSEVANSRDIHSYVTYGTI